jgi:RNA polymerase sigma-70 factor (ECF subfamily)
VLSQLSDDEQGWLERHAAAPAATDPDADGARSLVRKVLEQLYPASRMVIQLLELEDRSLKEISALTGWSVVLVKVRAFRARREMRKILERLDVGKYL